MELALGLMYFIGMWVSALYGEYWKKHSNWYERVCGRDESARLSMLFPQIFGSWLFFIIVWLSLKRQRNRQPIAT